MLNLRKTHDLAARHVAVRLLIAGKRCFSKDYASSDDEKDPKHTKAKKEHTKTLLPDQDNSPSDESASAKLNRLLASMQTADDQWNFAKRADIIAKPGETNRKKKLVQKQEKESKDIFAAAQKIASLLGNEKQKQTESELLSRLLGGKPNASDATKTEEEGSANKGVDTSLSELIVGMKIDRRPQQNFAPNTRSEYVRRSLAAKGNQQEANRKDWRRPLQRKRDAEFYTGSVNLSDGEPLGIFTTSSELKDSVELLPTWSYLHEQALKIQVSHPPSNYFDKIARWTEQGKVWRFPIDNEQDWLDETDVDFSEHIFLEQHLEDWCPNRGPIRHFMELVCVGLSKNPYITAQEKKDHILWYRDYFESKRDILKEFLRDKPGSEKSITADKQQQKQLEAS